MSKQAQPRVPRYGIANPYKRRDKAEKAAEILTELHKQSEWRYVVIEFDAVPPTWVVLREKTEAKGNSS
jgi:hypothetical protein